MSAPRQVVIWDGFVRIFHWSVASLFLLNFWVLEEGDPPHEWAGYLLMALVLLRIFWGFFGSNNARFSSFLPTPKRIKKHIDDLVHQRVNCKEGHNPLGGAMVITLLVMLLLVGLSGWLQMWDMFWGEGWLEDLHKLLANMTFFLVVIHVAAVVVMTRITGISLIKTMLTGRREA